MKIIFDGFVSKFNAQISLFFINGKKKATIEAALNCDQETIMKEVEKLKNIQIPKNQSDIKKIIFIKNKIVNIVL